MKTITIVVLIVFPLVQHAIMAAVFGTYRSCPNDSTKPGQAYCVVLPTLQDAQKAQKFIIDTQKYIGENFFDVAERTEIIEHMAENFGNTIDPTHPFHDIVKFVKEIIISDEYEWSGSADAHVIEVKDGVVLL